MGPVLALWLAVASQVAHAPEPSLPWLLGQDEPKRLAVAAALADGAASAQTVQMLWLLAHDPSLEVRMAALVSALTVCPKEPAVVCQALLAYFDEERVAPGSFRARQALLGSGGAVEETLQDSKLELVARLSALVGQPQAPPGGARALRLLAEDEDVHVQEAAGATLMGLLR